MEDTTLIEFAKAPKHLRRKVHIGSAVVLLILIVVVAIGAAVGSHSSQLVGGLVIAAGGFLTIRALIQKQGGMKPSEDVEGIAIGLVGVGGAMLVGAALAAFVGR